MFTKLKKDTLHKILNSLNQDLSEKEIKQFKNWIKDPENKKAFDEIAKINHIADLSVQEFNSKKAFKEFEAKTDLSNTSKIHQLLKTYYKYAAVILLVIVTTVFLINFNYFFSDNLISIEVPKGQISNHILPDGTKVSLNSGSKLTYNNNFIKNEKRYVNLEGEAFFEVTNYKDKHFIVESDLTKVKVLGTSFNIKSYKEDSYAEVSLLEGSVELTPKSEAITPFKMVPGNIAFFKKENDNYYLINAKNVSEVISWKNKEIVFVEEHLIDMMNELMRFFDVKIVLQDNVKKDLTFTASFDKGSSLEEVLDALGKSGDFSYRRVLDNVHNPNEKDVDNYHIEIFPI